MTVGRPSSVQAQPRRGVRRGRDAQDEQRSEGSRPPALRTAWSLAPPPFASTSHRRDPRSRGDRRPARQRRSRRAGPGPSWHQGPDHGDRRPPGPIRVVAGSPSQSISVSASQASMPPPPPRSCVWPPRRNATALRSFCWRRRAWIRTAETWRRGARRSMTSPCARYSWLARVSIDKKHSPNRSSGGARQWQPS